MSVFVCVVRKFLFRNKCINITIYYNIKGLNPARKLYVYILARSFAIKEKLTISKHWNNPEIKTTITNEAIGLKMDIADFITALKDEIGEVSYKPVNKSDLSKAIIDLIGKVTWKISQANFEVQVKEIINNGNSFHGYFS
jgi:lipoate-protein ligase A